MKVSSTVNFDSVATATEGFSGADLQALMYNAHLEVVNASIAAAAASTDPSSSTSNNGNDQEEQTVEFNVFGGPDDGRKLMSKAEVSALQQRVRFSFFLRRGKRFHPDLCGNL